MEGLPEPTPTTGIVFGDAPPPHLPWLASTFMDVIVWEMHAEK